MTKKENLSIAQCNCVRLSSEFGEKETQNSFITSSSTSTQIDSCAKLNGGVYAVAEAKEYWEREIIKMNKKINKAYEKSFHNDRLLYETYMKYLDNLDSKNTKIHLFRELIQALVFVCLLYLSGSVLLQFFSLILSSPRLNFSHL